MAIAKRRNRQECKPHREQHGRFDAAWAELARIAQATKEADKRARKHESK